MNKLKGIGLKQTLPWILVVGGIVGLLSSFILSMDKIRLLENPSYQLSCNINPILSCGSVIGTKQASAFGFPNPFIGLAGFSVIITIGMALFAGANFKRWFWRGLQIGTLFGVVFFHWLTFQSLYVIGALCVYCMAVWAITWPIFWYSLLYNLREKNITTPKQLKNIVAFSQRHHADILAIWYVIILGLILNKFWYYWSTLL